MVVSVAYASFVCIKFVVNPNAIIRRYGYMLKIKVNALKSQ